MQTGRSPAGSLPRIDRKLSRQQRLTRSTDIQRVFSEGTHCAGRYVVMWVADGSEDATRLGVVASKRTFRRAVDRARAKRLLREAFRINRHHLVKGKDIVLVARRAILSVKRPVVDVDLLKVADRQALRAKAGVEEKHA